MKDTQHILVISHGAVGNGGWLGTSLNEQAIARAKKVIEMNNLEFDIVMVADIPAARETVERLGVKTEKVLPIAILDPKIEQFQKGLSVVNDLGMFADMSAYHAHPNIHSLDSMAEMAGEQLDRFFFEREVTKALIIVFPPITNLLSMWFRCSKGEMSEIVRGMFLTTRLSSCEGFLLLNHLEDGKFVIGFDKKFPSDL